jgi:transcriptional regulator with XRE-family HTH domain
MALGDRIKEARKKRGLTQKDLAVLINAKHNSISNWENNQNKPDPDTIELICGALDVSPSWLMGYNSDSTEARLLTYNQKWSNIQKNSNILNYLEKLNNIGLKEAEKRIEELTYIPRYCKEIPSHLIPIAAHNEDSDNEEQQKLMQEDLNDL